MEMIKLELPDMPMVGALLNECFIEAAVSDRVSIDECLSWGDALLRSGKGSLWVDSLEIPTRLLVLAEGTSVFPKEKPLTLILIYAAPPVRSAATFNEMARFLEGQAMIGGFNCIYASDWVYGRVSGGSSPGLGPLWESRGFKHQESLYIKRI